MKSIVDLGITRDIVNWTVYLLVLVFGGNELIETFNSFCLFIWEQMVKLVHPYVTQHFFLLFIFSVDCDATHLLRITFHKRLATFSHFTLKCFCEKRTNCSYLLNLCRCQSWRILELPEINQFYWLLKQFWQDVLFKKGHQKDQSQCDFSFLLCNLFLFLIDSCDGV